MCGIYATNKNFNSHQVHTKLESIKYRGPDNTGVEKIRDVVLGHLRLSIIDLEERSNQPFNYKHLSITFNGEIYNFVALKNDLIEVGYTFETESDTEVLLVGYYHWGVDLLSRANGMFAFCIYDSIKNELFCARDRLGVKPFYYYWKDGWFEICSQLRPLINDGSKINEEAIYSYLDCGYIPSPMSILENVNKLQPGKYLVIDLTNKKLSQNYYWDLKKVVTKKVTYKQAKLEIHELIKDAVKIRMQSDVPLGSFLSGGIDSALITAIASNISNEKINTFSIGFSDLKFDESKIAEKYAEILKTNHKTIICKPEDILGLIKNHQYVYDEPFADSSALPSMLLNKVTKKYVTVALSGDGGDESFLGYNYFAILKKYRLLFLLPGAIKCLLINRFTLQILNRIKNIPLTLLNIHGTNDYVVEYFTGFNSLQKNRSKDWFQPFKNYLNKSNNYLQRAADLNIKLWLENDSNVKVDRASMAYSVEVRSPFLDYRIIENARILPIKFRFGKGVRKRILRDILKEYIPEKIFNQPKKGFSIPLADWIRTILKNEVLEALDDNFLNSVPNLDVSKFKSQLNSHMNNEGDYQTNIWKMFVLSKWYKEFNLYLQNY
jgi:asparagine synthase (glutamine-hydrolysing)